MINVLLANLMIVLWCVWLIRRYDGWTLRKF